MTSRQVSATCENEERRPSRRRNVHLNEGLEVQGGAGLIQPHTLLLVLLQSQRVDGEQRHVGLDGGKSIRHGLIFNKQRQNVKVILVSSAWVYMCYAVFAGLV